MTGAGGVLLPLAALAGGLAVVAAREAVLATPLLAEWVAGAIAPLRRAAREGYAPTRVEQRRLAVLGGLVLAVGSLLLAGPALAALAGAGGPAAAGWAVRRRQLRYRSAVGRALPQIAIAIADAVTAGRSVRAALAGASASLDGPAATEMARVRAELALGAPTRIALSSFRRRAGSPRVDAFVAAIATQELAGGDLAALLRRFAAAAAERDRVAADARSATAQARFTGLLVVAMPTGAALFAELVEPGFVAGLFAKPAAAVALAMALVLQLAGFVAIRRLGLVAEADG